MGNETKIKEIEDITFIQTVKLNYRIIMDKLNLEMKEWGMSNKEKLRARNGLNKICKRCEKRYLSYSRQTKLCDDCYNNSRRMRRKKIE